MDRRRTRRLNWFFDFLSTNLDKLGQGEFAKVATELSLTLLGRTTIGRSIEAVVLAKIEETDYTMSRNGLNKMKATQESLRSYVEQMMDGVKKTTEDGLTKNGFAHDIPRDEYTLTKVNVNIITTAGMIVSSSVEKQEENHSIHRWSKEEIERAPIMVYEMALSGKEALIFQFVRALNGFSLSAIRQCPECERWYVHTTKRKKIYCSNRCAARKTSRDRRKRKKEQDPAAYERELKGNAERARKSYENKIKAALPGAKIVRRPRKYHPE